MYKRQDYGGELPDSLEELTKLPGVGRKTANLVMGDIFGKPAVVTDTHCIRICGRLGLTKETEPYKVCLLYTSEPKRPRTKAAR